MKKIFYVNLMILFTCLTLAIGYGKTSAGELPPKIKKAVDDFSRKFNLTTEQEQQFRELVDKKKERIVKIWKRFKNGKITKKEMQKKFNRINQVILKATSKFLNGAQKKKLKKILSRKTHKKQQPFLMTSEKIKKMLQLKDSKEDNKTFQAISKHLSILKHHIQTSHEFRKVLQKALTKKEIVIGMLESLTLAYEKHLKKAREELHSSYEKISQNLSSEQKFLLKAILISQGSL